MGFANTINIGFRRVAKDPRILKRWKNDPVGLFKYVLAQYQFERAKTDKDGFVTFLIGEDGTRFAGEPRAYGMPNYDFLFNITRALNPKRVVETGVQEGWTSGCILSAMEKNNCGWLYSIELGLENALDHQQRLPRQDIGREVPDGVRGRWQIVWGDARIELPRLLESLGEIDIFLHDSLHTDEHMAFEYRTAWKHLRPGGVLLSDDISYAFLRFAREVRHPYSCFGWVQKIGGIRKET